jgi:ElaB/YqjD/DUF883 family membrane-anchored ribosome-binding protein
MNNEPNAPRMPNPSRTPAPEAAREMGDRVADAASQAKETVSEYASQAKEKAAELARTAAQKVDEGRVSAANAMESTASTLRTSGQTSGQKITSMANTAADTLQSTAEYMRQHDVRGMMGDLEQMVRRNPGPSLIAAAAVGFLLATAVRRD